MSDKETKSPVKRFFLSRLFLIIGIPFAALIVLGSMRAYYSGYKINQEISALKEEIGLLEHKKLESMEILNYVMSDNFVEGSARVGLNMKKEGENVLVFKNENTYERREDGADGSSGQNISNPLKWWYYFTNKDHVKNGQ